MHNIRKYFLEQGDYRFCSNRKLESPVVHYATGAFFVTVSKHLRSSKTGHTLQTYTELLRAKSIQNIYHVALDK